MYIRGAESDTQNAVNVNKYSAKKLKLRQFNQTQTYFTTNISTEFYLIPRAKNSPYNEKRIRTAPLRSIMEYKMWVENRNYLKIRQQQSP